MRDAEKAWIEKFIRHLLYERRLSELTATHYRRDLEALSAYCDVEGIDRWADLDNEHVRRSEGVV